ncbi:MAG: GlsB/YeaQ/YmgE family stress response membrane protein [Methyloceanibacter sp.]|nr:GlsB/YeaQ/YmgE family stress response membrane protein [Methyloceanibacter sp.]
MSISLAQLVVWLIVGALAGALAGMVVTGKREGLGRWPGLAVGLVGALIGGAIFRLLGIWPGLDTIAISLRDVLAAFIGSLIFLVILWFVKTRRTGA